MSDAKHGATNLGLHIAQKDAHKQMTSPLYQVDDITKMSFHALETAAMGKTASFFRKMFDKGSIMWYLKAFHTVVSNKSNEFVLPEKLSVPGVSSSSMAEVLDETKESKRKYIYKLKNVDDSDDDSETSLDEISNDDDYDEAVLVQVKKQVERYAKKLEKEKNDN